MPYSIDKLVYAMYKKKKIFKYSIFGSSGVWISSDSFLYEKGNSMVCFKCLSNIHFVYNNLFFIYLI